ncbi:MAG: hypothetical protein L7S63_01595 [Flavobacteriales bacterium]|nr:hypothetical protein [Flavobacteriales bacterium]
MAPIGRRTASAASLLWGALLLVQCGGVDPTAGKLASRAAEGWGALVFHLADGALARIPATRDTVGITLSNGAERIVLARDSGGCYQVPVFDGRLCLSEDAVGQWTDPLRTGEELYSVDVEWVPSARPRIVADTATQREVWRMEFGLSNPWYGDLVFTNHSDGSATGTIETATGDFRFLHGHTTEDKLTLQTFDGAHLFLFTAETHISDSLVNGVFYSGNHYSTPFKAHRRTDSDPALSEGNQAAWTALPIGYTGEDLSGSTQHWSWDPADSITHIISVMGSWCPNCMDEHRLLVSLMDGYPNVAVHTLAFERGLDRPEGQRKALERLRRYVQQMDLERFGDRWQVRLAGPASKTEAQQRLPFLDKVVSFPTTVVMRPGSDAPWIHSGFNGPATGAKYDLERLRFVAAISGSKESR